MIKFLAKGLARDKTRSLFPTIIITVTVAIVIFALGFMRGMLNSVFLDTAVIISGYEKVVTRAYKKEMQMLPLDLALMDIEEMISGLNRDHPGYFWSPRINFGGLIDIPDENKETRSQSPIMAIGIDFFSNKSRQTELWKLDQIIVDGLPPRSPNDILISSKLAKKLEVSTGQEATFIGSTMDNAFTTYNFNISGIFNLNKGQTDKQMILLDISGAQEALDMNGAATEILGFTNDLFYNDEDAIEIRSSFNENNRDSSDIFAPIMIALRDTNQMGTMVDFSNAALAVIGGIFLVIVMIVLWNMGLMNGLRRYGEIGLRLAMGESKGQVYRSMITEAVIIGLTGTLLGTGLGLSITYYVQENGISYAEALEEMALKNMVMPNVFYSKVTPDLFYVGLLPGLLATVLGTMLAGLAIYRREMAQLFKELET
jgi:putative ABC transport system permease protein